MYIVCLLHVTRVTRFEGLQKHANQPYQPRRLPIQPSINTLANNRISNNLTPPPNAKV